MRGPQPAPWTFTSRGVLVLGLVLLAALCFAPWVTP